MSFNCVCGYTTEKYYNFKRHLIRQKNWCKSMKDEINELKIDTANIFYLLKWKQNMIIVLDDIRNVEWIEC